jgi:hypothetical protein
LESLRGALSNRKADSDSKDGVFRKFLAKIAPAENETAEQELRKEFRRQDFRLMDIYGQVR